MSEQVRDLYFLLLGMRKRGIKEFSQHPSLWPRQPKELWYRGNIIEYQRVLELLDDVSERA